MIVDMLPPEFAISAPDAKDLKEEKAEKNSKGKRERINLFTK